MSNMAVDARTNDVQSDLERREAPRRESEGNPIANAVAGVCGVRLFVPLMLTMWLGIYLVIAFMRL